MGTTKELYERLVLHKDGQEELWQYYHIEMARKYFPEGCNICGSTKAIILCDSTVIYGSSYGLIYLCTECRSYVGVHGDHRNGYGEANAPKGLLADADMRRLRKEAHKYFDTLWKNTKMTRKGAYKVLMRVTKVDEKDAHIAMLPREKLIILIDYLKNLKVNRNGKESS